MKRVLVFLLLMVIPVFGMTATIHVPGDQPTIQEGIDAAVDGDTVLVAPGTYVENIHFLGKAITVISEQGPEVTIIDGGSPPDPEVASVVTFKSGEGPDSVLEGFTVTNGTGTFFEHPGFYPGYQGGGIFTHYSSPTIKGNIITGNLLLADFTHGGGIFANNASPTITGNTISGNTAAAGGGIEHQVNCFSIIADNTITENTGTYFGGGIALFIDCNPAITNNIIEDNVANATEYYGGGGIQMDAQCSPTITGNTISGNSTNYTGGGIDIQDDCHPLITNNSFTDNLALYGGGIYCWAGVDIQTPTINNNIFTGNSADVGGALSLNRCRSMVLSNNTITGNTADSWGAGIECYWSTLEFVNTILWNNTAPTGPEIWIGFIWSEFTISYSDVSGGMDAVYLDDIGVLNWGDGMIDADPQFLEPDEGDFHLCQDPCEPGVTNLCVDSGDQASEMIWGATRTDSVQDAGTIDMGYHYPGLERLVVGPGPAYDNPPLVRVVYPLQDAGYEYEFSAYGPTHYGVNVTCGNVDHSDVDEIITGAGPGEIYGPHVRGFQVDSTPLPGLSFMAYGTNRWGVNVAAGDIDADGFDEIITGAGPGAVFGPHVRAWNYDGSGSVTVFPGVSYFAYGTPKWGVNVSAGDIDGDGYDEIVTGAGPGSVYGPHVRGWNVDGGAAASIGGVSFLAYGTNQWGVNVTCGDVDGDGIDEIITGPGPGVVFGAHVRGWNYDGGPLTPMSGISFMAFSSLYGAKVFAGADLNDDGRDEIVVGCGPDPDPAVGTLVRVYQYDGSQISGENPWFSLEAFPGMTHGTTVAAGRF